jgi:hypothetical protein
MENIRPKIVLVLVTWHGMPFITVFSHENWSREVQTQGQKGKHGGNKFGGKTHLTRCDAEVRVFAQSNT